MRGAVLLDPRGISPVEAFNAYLVLFLLRFVGQSMLESRQAKGTLMQPQYACDMRHDEPITCCLNNVFDTCHTMCHAGLIHVVSFNADRAQIECCFCGTSNDQ